MICVCVTSFFWIFLKFILQSFPLLNQLIFSHVVVVCISFPYENPWTWQMHRTQPNVTNHCAMFMKWKWYELMRNASVLYHGLCVLDRIKDFFTKINSLEFSHIRESFDLRELKKIIRFSKIQTINF